MHEGLPVKVLRTTALLGALVVVLILARQSRSLRAELTRVTLQAKAPPLGLRLPSFRAATFRGDSVTIGGSAQVLFFLSTTCDFCERTLPAWQEIVTRLEGDGRAVQLFGVTQEPDSVIGPYAARHGLTFAIARFPDSTLPMLYRAEAVPLTVVLDRTGQVLKSRLGALSRHAVDSVVLLVGAPGTRGSPRP